MALVSESGTEKRSERLVVLVTPTEKQHIQQRSRRHQMPVAEFMRMAAADFEAPNEVELRQLKDLLDQLEEANSRTQASLERLQKTEGAAKQFDEDAFRAGVRKKLEEDMTTDWTAVLEQLGLHAAA